ncbi:YbaB/EbfC family nucleoid-associated protein [Glycomyces paridis]|uniref:YbaB/EbfC family nucleoid-associated protein n=1 Tax=Glycomyces paridis TaxID=2126555 RepID=A0A4S8PHL9_9ACTN|nr:YbaB/EbfC family nucleoid-associated protein [Glycomyces paridis]THV30093.1 YbaB/EbfC family nucleoid-associated protein [Glycomyces paridis]
MSDRLGGMDPEAMMARLEQMRTDAEAMLAKYEALAAEAGTDAVEVYSEDGYLRVKLDGDGKVAEIGIDEYAMRMKQTLGPSIIALINEAKATYGMKMAAMAQELVGDKIDVMGMVTRNMPDYMQERARGNLER